MASEEFRVSLGGLRQVGVQVEPVNADAERDGLLREDLRAIVEAALQASGIGVVDTPHLFADIRGTPFLHVDVMTIRVDGRYAYSVRLELWQAVRLERDPAISTLGATWSGAQVVGTVEAERLVEVTAAVRAAVQEFTRDCAAVPEPPRRGGAGAGHHV
jgi:hypothetical protein